MLRVKLKHLDHGNDERRRKATFYTKGLKGTGVVCPEEKASVRHVYHLYVVRAKKEGSLKTFLEKRGIGTLIHYPIPIHLQQAYKHLGYARGDIPVTEACAREILSLPLFPELTDSDIETVVLAIREFMDLPAAPSVGTGAGRQGRPF